MIERIKTFARAQSGAISVDWVVLSAGVIVLAAAATAAVALGMVDLGDIIGNSVSVGGDG